MGVRFLPWEQTSRHGAQSAFQDIWDETRSDLSFQLMAAGFPPCARHERYMSDGTLQDIR